MRSHWQWVTSDLHFLLIPTFLTTVRGYEWDYILGDVYICYFFFFFLFIYTNKSTWQAQQNSEVRNNHSNNLKRRQKKKKIRTVYTVFGVEGW